MSAPDVFGICTRVIGLLVLIYGLWCLPFGVHSFYSQDSEDSRSSASDYFVGGLTLSAIGIWLLLRADSITNWAY